MNVPTNISLFMDIAGRVTESTGGYRFLAMSCVAIPSNSLSQFRNLLCGLPKWKGANNDSIEVVKRVIGHTSMFAGTVVLEKTPPAWKNFWTTGKLWHDRFASQMRGKVGEQKPGVVLRYSLFGNASACCLGSMLRVLGRPVLLDSNGNNVIHLDIVLDTDIAGSYGRQAFAELVKGWAQTTQLREQLSISPVVRSVCYKTEQDEPLILLPDYLAGIANMAANKSSRLQPSSASISSIRQLQDKLTSSPNIVLDVKDFDYSYPDYSDLF